jgi:hypothetical protein
MKICAKCSKNFPTWIKIENIPHNLGNRKYCLECSPFKQHNTKQLIKGQSPRGMAKDMTERQCTGCNAILPNTSEFFYHNDNQRKIHSRCKKCMTSRAIDWQRANKKIAVEYKGGKCLRCGYSKYIGALDFHHRDPSQKDFQLSRALKGKVLETTKKELDKCDLLCSNCHREVHGIT